MEDPRESEEGIKCGHPLDDRNRTCYTQITLLQQDLRQRVQELLSATPTLRQVTLMWVRCYTEVPVRIVGIDLDNVPHSVDRPGEWSDRWEKDDRDW